MECSTSEEFCGNSTSVKFYGMQHFSEVLWNAALQ
jgi:hypothetical protein